MSTLPIVGDVEEDTSPPAPQQPGHYCEECGKGPYESKAGLGSHKHKQHGYVDPKRPTEKRKDQPQVVAAPQEKKDYYRTVKGATMYFCGICGESFNTSAGRGRHKRKHGILGQSSTATKERQRRQEAGLPLNSLGNAQKGRIQCLYCEATFAGQRWRSKHINLVHPGKPVRPITLTVRKGETIGRHQSHPQPPEPPTESHPEKRKAIQDDHLPAQEPEIPKQYQQSVAYTVGQLREICRANAEADDIPGRAFASWCAFYLLRATVR